MRNLLVFILGLFLISALFRVDFFFYLLYVFFGVYFLSRLWAERSLRGIEYRREYPDRAFLGERLSVKLHMHNQGPLPTAWLRIHESLPIQLKSPNFHRCVFSLLPHEEKTFTYQLDCRRRGYYLLGPLLISSGDFFGIHNQEKREASLDALIVYPRIVPLGELGLPAQSPFGVIPAKQRVFEDPTRMIGVREYQSGDSMRHINWKTTATTGVLQTKRFEPAISIESQILLNLNREEYTRTRANVATELGIVTAASIANHLVEKKQAVGLSCNGIDPLVEDSYPIALPPRKGREHLMHILDILARVRTSEDLPFSDLLREASLHLTWGGTGIVISAHADDALFENVLLMKRSGYHVVLILLDPRVPFVGIQQRAREVGIRAYQIWRERDLDVWR